MRYVRRVGEVSSWGLIVNWVGSQIDRRGRIQKCRSYMDCPVLCENGLLLCVIACIYQGERVRVKMFLAVVSE